MSLEQKTALIIKELLKYSDVDDCLMNSDREDDKEYPFDYGEALQTLANFQARYL